VETPGAGPPLVLVGTIRTEAAPPFVIFERWALRTSPFSPAATRNMQGLDRKDGAPSVGMVHPKIIGSGPPAGVKTLAFFGLKRRRTFDLLTLSAQQSRLSKK
jgi:hypothetical protein